MKKIIFLAVIVIALMSNAWAIGAEDPQTVKPLSAWVTYSDNSPEYMKECPSYILLLQSNGVATVRAQYEGQTLQQVEGTWRIEGRKIIFEGLSICDAVTGEDATYKSAVVKSDNEGFPYLVVKTTAGTRYFITL